MVHLPPCQTNTHARWCAHTLMYIHTHEKVHAHTHTTALDSLHNLNPYIGGIMISSVILNLSFHTSAVMPCIIVKVRQSQNNHFDSHIRNWQQSLRLLADSQIHSMLRLSLAMITKNVVFMTVS
jgi:hypothetical protein